MKKLIFILVFTAMALQLVAIDSHYGFNITSWKLLRITSNFEFGLSYLRSPDYSNYPTDTKEFLDLQIGKSIHFGWNPVVVKASFNRRNTLGIASGLTLVWRDYAFSDRSMTVAKIDGMLSPVSIENYRRLKKSKLTTFALRVPLLFTVAEPKSKIGVGLGGYVDFMAGAHTKYKFRKHKDRGDFYVEPIQFGLQARIRHRSVGLFANYGLSDMFMKNKAPATRSLTIGIGLGF